MTGAHSHIENEEHLSANPNLIALRSGRPVLVVPDGYVAPAPGSEVLLHNLERHGIQANLLVRSRHKSIAKTILTTARNEGAKVVIMGAFEHSKFSHDVFGGVTTDVIGENDVPVLLSH